MNKSNRRVSLTDVDTVTRRNKLVGELQQTVTKNEEVLNDRETKVRDTNMNKTGIDIKTDSLLQMGCINVRNWDLVNSRG